MGLVVPGNETIDSNLWVVPEAFVLLNLSLVNWSRHILSAILCYLGPRELSYILSNMLYLNGRLVPAIMSISTVRLRLPSAE